ncbi:ribosomal protein S18 acetylase RimI-like enzyme [Clostridium saccharoperbutylacetonicum]|uniref:Acetyltransferase, GNAT family n=1 Tax=Clostridium saccharoperbutylacetonicum N1-4(HMT) TaxID=931276 RepID=M1MXH9_9CLOT|nr:GNAT family N-acetyltransferase [Clostridium saccharoperbutylacetonicum]AGF56152.1 acetyltransferase, GNAT family [Clostridium saccharoperbutylacetonicum N1-4(HMT)]NRT63107.1 ribosomal protein S18 acetylase RimI-like enzyme [Clostridium saccharoperbutylacetonicum]NSB26464.1 ribosomal protein S18 acetylase RimI-like enzyme [Clostridium saccharoperbutylacetonicum]NSB45817.1 ribosomal protein S18 acetylase RimI-like enzyme [Clostridium saccharoperbutylacetonicum]
MKFKVTDKIKKQDEETIFKNLLEYNLARIEDKNPKDLGVYLEDEKGEMIGGLIGNTHGNWLTIKFLWVSENVRGQSIGSKLLKKAEETAKERGCKYVFLDTFSFQAPEFYKKYGYEEKFVLEEYPIKGKRHYYTKTL